MFKLSIIAIFCVSWAVSQKTTQKIKPSENSAGSGSSLYFFISASNLSSVDGGIVDPFVEVYYGSGNPNAKLRTSRGNDVDAIGVTETINDQPNPEWNKIFKVQWNKGADQKIYLKVRDDDPKSQDPVVIGDAFINLDEYVTNGYEMTAPLGSNGGSVTIKNASPFRFTLSVKNIPANDDFGGLSDPLVVCYLRNGKDGKESKIFETSSVDNTEHASWENPLTFSEYRRGTNQVFHFKVFDYDVISANDLIGEAFLELDAFVDKKQRSVRRLSRTTNATLYINYVLE